MIRKTTGDYFVHLSLKVSALAEFSIYPSECLNCYTKCEWVNNNDYKTVLINSTLCTKRQKLVLNVAVK